MTIAACVNIAYQRDFAREWADSFRIRSNVPSSTFSSTTTGSGFEWGHLAIVALWGLAGFVLALRFFRWTPRSS